MLKNLPKLFLIFPLLLSLLFINSAQADDDLLQAAGSWLQIVGEGSLKFVDPSLENGRIWLEGQSRFNDNWDHWYRAW